jgi:Methyltransferase domain
VGCNDDFASALIHHFRSGLAEEVRELDDAALDRRIKSGVTKALTWGLTTPASIAEYVHFSLALGPGFTQRFHIREHFSKRQASLDDGILTLRAYSHPNSWFRPEPGIIEQEWQALLGDNGSWRHPEILGSVLFDSPVQRLPNYGFCLDAPYVKTPAQIVRTMLEVARVGHADTVMDLGSGDGRIVITAARLYGCRGIGVDLDPKNVEAGRRAAEEADVSHLVKFVRDDLYEVNLSEATVVTLFLLGHVNMALRERLRRELRPGSRVVSRCFHMGDWTPDAQVGELDDTVYCWRIG